MLMWPSVGFLVVALKICLAGKSAESGPYKVQITHLNACNDTGKNDFALNVIEEYQDGDKNKPCFTGNVSLSTDLTDAFLIKLEIQQLVNNSWQDFINFEFEKGCSDTVKYKAVNWFYLLNKVNINATGCPIPKGFYSFKCVIFDGDQMGSQLTAKYGTYRAFQSVWDNGAKVGCVTAEGTITPA